MSTILLKTWNQDQLATVASRKLYIFFLSLLESCKCILNVLKKSYLRIENLVWTGRSDYFIVYVIGEQERGAETCGRYMYMYLFSLDVIF